MTPQEKAKELVEKFQKHAYGRMGSPQNIKESKQCALICLEIEKDLLTKLYKQIPENIDRATWRKWRVSLENQGIENEQVKEEIEKL